MLIILQLLAQNLKHFEWLKNFIQGLCKALNSSAHPAQSTFLERPPIKFNVAVVCKWYILFIITPVTAAPHMYYKCI